VRKKIELDLSVIAEAAQAIRSHRNDVVYKVDEAKKAVEDVKQTVVETGSRLASQITKNGGHP
jgi:hypothetical protein